MQPKKVLGFDPGYERLGVALVERAALRESLLYSTCIHTSKSDPFPLRLRALGDATEKVIAKERPDALALERLYLTKNHKTAMGVAEVRGMLLYLAGKHALPVFEYTPMQVKLAVTGHGKSDKASVLAMVSKLIELPVKPMLDDEIDAIAVALTCLASTRRSL